MGTDRDQDKIITVDGDYIEAEEYENNLQVRENNIMEVDPDQKH